MQAEKRPTFEAANNDSPAAGKVFVAGFLGWMLDAFDFFVLIFVLPAVAKDFHRSIPEVAFAITLTLAMRPLGALIFGWMADRFGRRGPLMINIIFYSIIEVLSGLAPNYQVFLLLRALYGIGMGGEWGVGASLTMEAAAPNRRGMFSGLLQEGYSAGYLLAAAAYYFIFPSLGWRALFFVGGAPALLTLYIRAHVPESRAWQQQRPSRAEIVNAVRSNLKLFVYLVVVMTAMSFVSHGTQDIYPTFLERERLLPPHQVAAVAIIYNIGALVGGLFFGHISDRIGRKRAMVGSLAIAFAVIPLWLFPRELWLLTTGAFVMQFMVQGAFGVIPAHLTELSPPKVRGLFAGLTYQLGVLLAAGAPYFEARMASSIGYEWALAWTAGAVFLWAIVAIGLGPERRGADLVRA